jgi:DNA repair protein RadC
MKRLGLSSRLFGVLHRAHIDDLEDLLSHDTGELARIPGMGETKLQELQQALAIQLGAPDNSLDRAMAQRKLAAERERTVAELRRQRRILTPTSLAASERSHLCGRAEIVGPRMLDRRSRQA